jgi:hypothetical protein
MFISGTLLMNVVAFSNQFTFVVLVSCLVTSKPLFAKSLADLFTRLSDFMAYFPGSSVLNLFVFVKLRSYEEQLRQRELVYQQQQQRLYQEVKEEKERVAESARRQRAELDALQRKLEETHSNMMGSVRTEYEAAKQEQERRHAVSDCFDSIILMVISTDCLVLL